MKAALWNTQSRIKRNFHKIHLGYSFTSGLQESSHRNHREVATACRGRGN